MKFDWNRCRSEKELAIRRMLWDDPVSVLRDYDRDYLRELFLGNLHRFDRVNLNFWKWCLKISDEEINRRAKENFRLACQIWRR